ncbi:hypothetical protein OH77DRAFT_1523623 [Trametes cingulata]|nr:hypothetical protein OH77DRAFT_1523623 [Trametes cingulata]
MAFPIPSHLPRRKDARDVSTQVLTKISETTVKDLNARAASSWVAELDETIRQTKSRIHERITSDLPDFERQLASSISVQERLRTLTQNVDVLNESVSSPESGLIPSLLTTLTTHSTLAQEAADARARHAALAHLLRCRDELKHLTQLVEQGQLPDATGAGTSLERAIAEAPEPLQRSEVMSDLKRRCSALRNRTEEQLMQAYSRSIIVTASEVNVRPHVQVPQSTAAFPLSSIIASMSSSALSSHVTTLRRDIITHCIEYVLKQPVTISQNHPADISGPVEHKLSLYPAPPQEEDLDIRLDRLREVMTFLVDHLFPHFPPAERRTLSLSLCTPIRTAILNNVLLPHLPSSLARLLAFHKLAKRAAQTEDDVVVKLLGDTSGERSVKAWVDGVGQHFARRKRAEILDRARLIVISPQDDSTSFRVEVPLVLEEAVPPSSVDAKAPETNGAAKELSTNGSATNESITDAAEPQEAENGWDFEDDTPSQSEESANGWDFEDDLEPAPEALPEAEAPPPREPEGSEPAEEGAEVEVEDDPWGWTDDSSPTTGDGEAPEESAWDDAWDEKPSEPEPTALAPISVPKPAKGLQKFSKSAPSTPALPPPVTPTIAPPLTPQPAALKPASQPPAPVPVKPVKVTESFLVSGRTKQLLQLVEDVLREGAEFVTSGILDSSVSAASAGIIVQAAPMALELYCALTPVVNAALLQQSAKEPMRFSNDCRFVGQELQHIVTKLSGPKAVAREQLQEGLATLNVLADSWFEDAVAKEERLIEELLEGARGFIDTTHQERYDECENAVNEVLRRIRRVAPQWKAVLAKSKYYDALGAIVETAVSRVLGDILALEDITEIESHRLSELCRILNALEGLFVEDPDQPSFVVSYVPSWLKFSYLSELLEASIADMSYLFEEGALVDFEIDELVKLVRALFADTPLRANTINRLLQGHPVRGS